MPSTQASQGHRKRLREKFVKSGLKGFHDYEIIELLQAELDQEPTMLFEEHLAKSQELNSGVSTGS